jgi:hypothetical protein
MPSQKPADDTIAAEEQRLYESASLRDDLNDEEAQTLLTWGQKQVRRLAVDYADNFEQKTRFLRQLIKGINRFVGQREFQQTREDEDKYMKKIMLWLPKLGWDDISREQLYRALPDDKADMAGNLRAILRVLSPPDTTTADGQATLSPHTEGQHPADSEPAASSSTPSDPTDDTAHNLDDTGDDNNDNFDWLPF